MKLISCYIENFGGLSQYTVEFQEGLTVIQEPNGFGKTTLAEFIRTMFYGFPRAAKTLEKNPRKRYAPWQGGKFGGHLTFSHNGRRYRIERSFGEVPRADTFALYDVDTQRKSKDFSENIGMELFQLDVESFERSTYMPQQHERGSLTTDSIQAKLGDLVEDTNDINNFDGAMAALRSKRSALIPFRGQGGAVAEAQRNISRLQTEVDSQSQAAAQLEALRAELEQSEEKVRLDTGALNALRQEMTLSAQVEARQAAERRYAELRQEMEKQRQRQQALEGTYPKGLPGLDEVEQAMGLAEKRRQLRMDQVDTPAERSAEAVVRSGAEIFAQGIPEESKLQSCQNHCGEYLTLGGRLEGCALAAQDRQRLQELEGFFAPGLPGEELEEARNQLSRWEELRQENVELSQLPSDEKKPGVGKAWIPVVLGLTAFAAGAALMLLKWYAGGAVCLGLGVVALIGAVYLRLKQMIAGGAAAETARANQERIRRNQAQIQALEDKLGALLGTWFPGDRAWAKRLEELAGKREQYLQLRRKQEQILAQRREIRDRMDQAEGQIRGFLERYRPASAPETFQSELLALRSQAGAYAEALRVLADRDLRREEKAGELERLEAAWNGFCDRYALAGDMDRRELQKLRDDVLDYEKAVPQAIQAEREARDYYEENRQLLDIPVPEQVRSLAELSRVEASLTAQLEGRREENLGRMQQLRKMQESADAIPGMLDELEAWKVRKETAQNQADTLDQTMEFLEKARENLANNYLSPVRGSFTGYLNRLTQEPAQKVFLNGELDVRMERLGQARELGYFSAGQTDMVMLCMRLALMDCLFREARPFLILDDPFVNLDDHHTAQALALLEELGRERQIIYLVCNSSRSPYLAQ